MITHLRHFDDLAFTVTAELHENGCVVEFAAFEFHMLGDERRYWETGATNPLPGVDSVEKSQPYLSGSVRFDGCSNWTFDESDRGCALHACSREDLHRWGEAMGRCWDWARELMGDTWDGGAPERAAPDEFASLRKALDRLVDELAKQRQKAIIYGSKAHQYRDEAIRRGLPSDTIFESKDSRSQDEQCLAYARSFLVDTDDSPQPDPPREG